MSHFLILIFGFLYLYQAFLTRSKNISIGTLAKKGLNRDFESAEIFGNLYFSVESLAFFVPR